MNHSSCIKCSLKEFNRCYKVPSYKPVDILFILDSPSEFIIHSKNHQDTYFDKDLDALRRMIDETKFNYIQHLKGIYSQVNFDITYDFIYTVSCVVDEKVPSSLYKTQNNKFKPSSKMVYTCHDVLFSNIERLKPKVIIPVGASAAKSIYIMYQRYTHVVARSINVKIGNQIYNTLPIMETEKIKKNDNDYYISSLAVENAIQHIFKTEMEPSLAQDINISKYIFPKTAEEVKDIIYNKILPAVSGENNDLLGLDIETNSKYAWYPDVKMISIAFSWAEEESCTIWCESRHSPYAWEDIKDAIADVLRSNAKKVIHNTPFDFKWLKYKYGFEVNNICWDTLFGEHILNENMKGFYNLEFLAGKYFPAYENYKKLALKKFSKKDDLQSNDIEEEDESVLKKTTIDNQAYQDAMMSHQEELTVYDNKNVNYELNKRLYNQELERWIIKYPKGTKLTKEVRSTKPKRPTKGFKKPTKPDLSGFEIETSKSDYEDYDPRDLEVYNSMDSDITRRIAIAQQKNIHDDDPDMFSIMRLQQIPVARALTEIEFVGAKLDHEYLKNITAELQNDFNELNYKLVSMSEKKDFKASSPQQVAYILCSKYGLSKDKWVLTEDKQISTSRENLIKYAKDIIEEIKPDIVKDEKKIIDFMRGYRENNLLGFISVLLTFRDVNKALNTTLKNFKRFSEPDGRLRSNFHINGTKTGRLSSSSLNLQNIALFGGGKNLKKCIIADFEDHVLVNVDIKAAEIRCLLAYAQEEGLIDALLKDFDMHAYVAAKVWKAQYPQYTEEELFKLISEANEVKIPTELQMAFVKLRKRTKSVTFGLVYGITKYGLARDLGCSETEAQQIIDMYFKTFPKIKKYMNDTRRHLEKHREVQSLTKRKRRFPRYSINRGGSYRQAINFGVQNIASDLVVRILAAMGKNIKEELGGRLVLTVHDSILMSLPKKNLKLIKPYLNKMIVEDVAQKYTWLPVPFEYDVEWGDNYGEMTKLTEEDYE